MSEERQARDPGTRDGFGLLELRNQEDATVRPVASWQAPVSSFLPGGSVFTTKSESSQPFSDEDIAVKRKCFEFIKDDVSQCGVSEVEEESFGFLWLVKSYSALAENGEIASPIFTGGSKSKHTWQLKIIPKHVVDGEECFGITLGLDEFGDGKYVRNRKVKGKFQINILDADWNAGVVADQPRWIDFRRSTVWGYKKVVLAATLSDPVRRLLENDSLKIYCHIRLLGDPKLKIYSGGAAVQNAVEEENVVEKHALAFDMGKALRTSLLTDIELEADDGSVFQAHKAILTARSPVFANLLTVDSCDSEVTKIFVHDFDAEVVKILLDYIYTGNTEEREVLKRRAIDLLQVGDKYSLDELKEDCENAIGESITLENAVDILVMSDLYQATLLKDIAMEYIERHKEEIYKIPSFQLVAKTKPHLLAELYLRTLVAGERPVEDTNEPMSPTCG